MFKCSLITLASLFCFKNTEGVRRTLCPSGEVFVECAQCGPKTCQQLGYPVPCFGVTRLCREQCVCPEGYVRNDTGTCISIRECPSCRNDKNATSGCGNHCGGSCSDYRDVNKTCLTGCHYNSCDCRRGYVYNEETSQCVLPHDCWENEQTILLMECENRGPYTSATLNGQVHCRPLRNEILTVATF